MRAIKKLGLIIVLMSVTACAPVVYDAGYRAPSQQVAVHATYSQSSHPYIAVSQQIAPIEVTLYADNAFPGLYFDPISVVISDNEYIEIPVRNRRGRHTKIFAHYYQRDFHFDSNRNHRNLYGSSRYKYDDKWDKGYGYTYVSVGDNYDFSGLRLHIRNAPAGKRMGRQDKVAKKRIVSHAKSKKQLKKQLVTKDNTDKHVKKKIKRKSRRAASKREAALNKSRQNNKFSKRTRRALKSKNVESVATKKSFRKKQDKRVALSRNVTSDRRCQSALKIDPPSASNFDPPQRVNWGRFFSS
jgi:hypothetical protein